MFNVGLILPGHLLQNTLNINQTQTLRGGFGQRDAAGLNAAVLHWYTTQHNNHNHTGSCSTGEFTVAVGADCLTH